MSRRDWPRRQAALGKAGAPGLRLYASLGLRLPADLARRLKVFSRQCGRSLNRIAAEALEEYLAGRGI